MRLSVLSSLGANMQRERANMQRERAWVEEKGISSFLLERDKAGQIVRHTDRSPRSDCLSTSQN
jgi:hypothetical protein